MRDVFVCLQLKELNHDNTQPFIGACVEPGLIYYLMQWCSRGSVTVSLYRHRVSAHTVAWRWLLQHCHSNLGRYQLTGAQLFQRSPRWRASRDIPTEHSRVRGDVSEITSHSSLLFRQRGIDYNCDSTAIRPQRTFNDLRHERKPIPVCAGCLAAALINSQRDFSGYSGLRHCELDDL